MLTRHYEIGEVAMGLPAKRWNQVRVAAWGAILGAAYLSATIFLREAGEPPASLVGEVFGGAAGGGLLFGLFAVARNLVVASSNQS
jgi:hypothetical protein